MLSDYDRCSTTDYVCVRFQLASRAPGACAVGSWHRVRRHRHQLCSGNVCTHHMRCPYKPADTTEGADAERSCMPSQRAWPGHRCSLGRPHHGNTGSIWDSSLFYSHTSFTHLQQMVPAF